MDTKSGSDADRLGLEEAFKRITACLKWLEASTEYSSYITRDNKNAPNYYEYVYQYKNNEVVCVRRVLRITVYAKTGGIVEINSCPVFEPVAEPTKRVAPCVAVDSVRKWFADCEALRKARYNRVVVQDCSKLDMTISAHQGTFCQKPTDKTALQYCWVVPFETADYDPLNKCETVYSWNAFVSCTSGMVVGDLGGEPIKR
jgi:hypothetical protein